MRLLPITAGLRETLGGLLPAHAFGAVPSAVWKRKIAVELTGSFFLFKAVLPRMMAQQWGRIINFTGLAALQGTDALAGSTELGMVGMTRGIAREYGQHNITANCIGAGGIEREEADGGLAFPPGPRDPLNRWGTPEEMAFLAVSLASEEESTAPSTVSEIGGLHSAVRMLGYTILQPNRNRTGLEHEAQGH